MKKFFYSLFVFFFLVTSCTKVESVFDDTNAITNDVYRVQANSSNVFVNDTVRFSVFSSNNSNVTNQFVFYVNGLPISGNKYVFNTEGTYAVYALNNTISTTVLVVSVSNPTTSVPPISNTDKFVHHVLVEEFSGTWCGNCPQILYGIDLLKQATNKAVVVGFHLFGDDPFITSDGNALANARQVFSVPTGHIKRADSWITPQYNNLTQVTNAIQSSSDVGIAIQSSLVNTNIQAIVKVRSSLQTLSNARLHCFLVEDNLKHTQRNYYPNLYGGAGSISNFNYNDVFRLSLTGLQGTVISLQQSEYSANLSINIPSQFKTSNLKLVAFVTDNSGKVVNASVAAVGQKKNFERL